MFIRHQSPSGTPEYVPHVSAHNINARPVLRRSGKYSTVPLNTPLPVVPPAPLPSGPYSLPPPLVDHRHTAFFKMIISRRTNTPPPPLLAFPNLPEGVCVCVWG
eukprot:Sspe_Gene.112841::Locus_96675_Transcript_1_1_Confidence_1.000_Length_333::g.112841::m.112841